MTERLVPRISIVIPVYNRIAFSRRCLQTVRGLTYPNVETLVVDNGSTDGTSEVIAQEFPWVKVIRNPSNLGYAGGCNVGIRASRGAYILLLNNDTKVVDSNLLQDLVGPMEEDERIAAVGPRIVDYDDYETIVFDGGGDALGFLEITGVALLLRRKALEEVGLFDESFFAYYEDRDLFARLRKAGWLLRHVNSVRVAHKGSVTAIPDSPFYHYYHNRNLTVLMRRHATLRHLIVSVAPKWLDLTAWFIERTLRQGDWQTLRAWLRGYLDGARAALADQPERGPPLGTPAEEGIVL